jgi:ribonuclease-3
MSITIESLLAANSSSLAALEHGLGYAFRKPAFLQEALIHSSYAFEHAKTLEKNNEKLEFLGDAVLDLVVGFMLFDKYQEMNEGDLTRLRAALVKESHLAQMAEDIDLGSCLLLGKGEDASAGRRKPSILSCAYEAVVGAVFLDGGYEAAASVIARHFSPWIDKRLQGLSAADSKSALQERLQERFSEGPEYFLEREDGPDHAKTFVVTVRFHDVLLGEGKGRSKKEAEKAAAVAALAYLESSDLLARG